MERGPIGEFQITNTGDEPARAFVPHPLPPNPPLQMDGTLNQALAEAMLALGRLDGISSLLPDPARFIYAYVRKEAVLSSQIEGTQSSLSDLLLYELEESPGSPIDDVVEVSNHVAAMEHGLKRLDGGFPLANKVILSLTGIRKMTGLSFPAASAAMDILAEQGVARKFTGRRRARLFAYEEYLAILNEGADIP